MSAPCKGHGGHFPEKGKPYVAGECRVCWLYVNHDGYRKRWGANGKVTSAPAKACRHIGKKLNGEFARAKGLDPVKRWTLCLVGLTKNPANVPGVVCPCTGCNSSCERFEVDPDE